MATINPGYMGYADISGGIGQFRFSSASISAKQEVEAPDLVTGDWNRQAWVYGKVEVTGSMSGPVTETFAGSGNTVWDWATGRTDCGLLAERDINLYYFCPPGSENNYQLIEGVLVNSVSFSASAGEVAEFSLDIVGTTPGAFSNQATTRNQTAEKLVTWDRVAIQIDNGQSWSNFTGDCFESFSFEINNNVETRYAICQDPAGQNLFPYALIPGMRTITGTLTGYNIPAAFGRDNWLDYQATDVSNIIFNIGGTTVSANVAFHRVEPSLEVGPITSTIAFTGVTTQPFDL